PEPRRQRSRCAGRARSRAGAAGPRSARARASSPTRSRLRPQHFAQPSDRPRQRLLLIGTLPTLALALPGEISRADRTTQAGLPCEVGGDEMARGGCAGEADLGGLSLLHGGFPSEGAGLRAPPSEASRPESPAAGAPSPQPPP